MTGRQLRERQIQENLQMKASPHPLDASAAAFVSSASKKRGRQSGNNNGGDTAGLRQIEYTADK
jgi:hypothetical protein